MSIKCGLKPVNNDHNIGALEGQRGKVCGLPISLFEHPKPTAVLFYNFTQLNHEADGLISARLVHLINTIVMKMHEGDKMKPKVALVKGGNRAENIDKSLRLLGDDIDLKDKKNVLIKVNFSSRDNRLGATNVDAVRALLKFLKERYAGKITIGESSWGSALARYKKFGYLGLEKNSAWNWLTLIKASGNRLKSMIRDCAL